jgi:hypothetical protein
MERKERLRDIYRFGPARILVQISYFLVALTVHENKSVLQGAKSILNLYGY